MRLLPAFPFDHSYSDDRKRPGITVPVTLSHGPYSLEVVAKVDTGAEFCLFERAVGEALGLEIEAGLSNRLNSLGGGISVFGHEITIETFDYQIQSLVYFIENPAAARNLLGRNGWLEHFRIAILQYDRELLLGPQE